MDRDGAFHPTADSSCECHYEGRTAQSYPGGDTFDSSYARGSPTSFAPNQVIKGWTEAMQLMVEGDKWEMYIPSELGYGDRGSPPKIGGGDVLVFTMEIIKIKGDKKAALSPSPSVHRHRHGHRHPNPHPGDKKPASKCDAKTYEGCTDKESTYLKAKAALDADALTAEIKRLNGTPGHEREPRPCPGPHPGRRHPHPHTHTHTHTHSLHAGMAAKKMSSTQVAWLSARVNLLGRLVKVKEEL